MSYSFPDEEILVRYLAMLSRVLILARHSAYESDPKMAQLLDAIHNVPDLLCRWQDVNESWVLADLEAYEAKYCGEGHPFSEILKTGADPSWQLGWKRKGENTDAEGV